MIAALVTLIVAFTVTIVLLVGVAALGSRSVPGSPREVVLINVAGVLVFFVVVELLACLVVGVLLIVGVS